MSKMTKVKEAEAILDDLGLSVTKSFELYYRQIIAHRGLPFELQIPNKKTIKAIENSRQGKGKHNVTIFRRYPFKVGQKIYIEDGARRGDWEVVGVSDRKLKLRCPISNREFEWNRFCYFMEEAVNIPWPHPDE